MIDQIFKALEIDRYSYTNLMRFMGLKKFAVLFKLNKVILYTDLEDKLYRLLNEE